MPRAAYLFHDAGRAQSALEILRDRDLEVREIARAPARIALGEEHPDEDVRAGLRGVLVGIAAFVALTVASIVALGGPDLDIGTLLLVLYHGALIGGIVGAAYGIQARNLSTPSEDVTLHGEDVLILAAGSDDVRGLIRDLGGVHVIDDPVTDAA